MQYKNANNYNTIHLCCIVLLVARIFWKSLRPTQKIQYNTRQYTFWKIHVLYFVFEFRYMYHNTSLGILIKSPKCIEFCLNFLFSRAAHFFKKCSMRGWKKLAAGENPKDTIQYNTKKYKIQFSQYKYMYLYSNGNTCIVVLSRYERYKFDTLYCIQPW